MQHTCVEQYLALSYGATCNNSVVCRTSQAVSGSQTAQMAASRDTCVKSEALLCELQTDPQGLYRSQSGFNPYPSKKTHTHTNTHIYLTASRRPFMTHM